MEIIKDLPEDIDPDVTLAGNKLKRHDVIIAKRVANELIKYNEY